MRCDVKLEELLNMMNNPRLDPNGERDWNRLLNYEIQIHTGPTYEGGISIESVYADDSDQSINIDVGLTIDAIQRNARQ